MELNIIEVVANEQQFAILKKNPDKAFGRAGNSDKPTWIRESIHSDLEGVAKRVHEIMTQYKVEVVLVSRMGLEERVIVRTDFGNYCMRSKLEKKQMRSLTHLLNKQALKII